MPPSYRIERRVNDRLPSSRWVPAALMRSVRRLLHPTMIRPQTRPMAMPSGIFSTPLSHLETRMCSIRACPRAGTGVLAPVRHSYVRADSEGQWWAPISSSQTNRLLAPTSRTRLHGLTDGSPLRGRKAHGEHSLPKRAGRLSRDAV